MKPLEIDKSWSEYAREAIAAVLSAYTRGGGDLVYLSEDDRSYLKKKIDGAYPFGERHSFPYKAWLIERRKVFIALSIPIVSLHRNQSETSQMSLFSTQTKRKK